MTSARRQLIDANATPFYHVINRCVRRAFLCGEDKLSGRSYEHRRGWIVDKIKALSAIFCIDICAYAVMSNHYHLVLKIDVDKAKSLTQKDIISRWCQITKGHAIATKYMNGDALIEGERMLLDGLITEWHERLSSISWFMRCLNEEIARKANREDECKGAFWEGRFKSQALLDEQALLACMMYVDLNPIRAKMAPSPEASNYTSIQQRLGKAIHCTFHGELLPFAGDSLQQNAQQHIPYHFVDYVELVNWTGQQMRQDKRGSINTTTPSILARLNIPTYCWLQNCQLLETNFHQVIGPISSLKQFCQKLGQRWAHGQTACRRSFG